jgi:hypothetical protein
MLEHKVEPGSSEKRDIDLYYEKPMLIRSGAARDCCVNS